MSTTETENLNRQDAKDAKWDRTHQIVETDEESRCSACDAHSSKVAMGACTWGNAPGVLALREPCTAPNWPEIAAVLAMAGGFALQVLDNIKDYREISGHPYAKEFVPCALYMLQEALELIPPGDA